MRAASVAGASSILLLPHLHLHLQIPSPSFLSPFPFPFSSSSSRLSLTLSPTNLPLSFSSFSQNPNFISSSYNEDDIGEEEEEQVIGDCLIFEDGIFDDPFLNQSTPSISTPTHKKKTQTSAATTTEIEAENLVPDEWKTVVDEINLTKKERRRIAKEMEFGQRILKNKKVSRVNLEEYLRYKDEKLAQLKPLVLDSPSAFPSNSEGGAPLQNWISSRVEPKNPRWDVYGRSLDDITEFFNSGDYQPNDDDNTSKAQGRQKMFTREEKALMNARIPRLAIATSQKWLPLHSLAASGEFYLMNNMMKFEVDINAADQDGLTALHKAIISKKQAITNYLLRESADPFVRDKDGATLMHYAVRTASSQAIKTLLLHNVDINLQDNDGWTPLHLAVQARRTDVVRLLLMKGADKTLKNQDGLTPLELCLYSGRDTKTYELIKLLKELPRIRR